MKRVFCTLVAAVALILFIPLRATAQYAYVTNSSLNSVSVVNTATNSVTATVYVGAYPTGSAVNPAGTRVYVANQGDNTVSVIDTTNNIVNAAVKVGAAPNGIAVNPSGSFVYTANSGDNTVSVINTATNQVTATVKVGNYPTGVVVNPSGTTAYVTNNESNSVSVIDTATNSVTATLNGLDGPWGVAVNPAGTRLYVANVGFSFAGNTVSVIDTNMNKIIATVNVGPSVRAIAVNPSGTRAYAANQGIGIGNVGGGVSVIDTGTNLVTATVRLDGAYGIAVNPAGTFVYVTPPQLSVISTVTNTLAATVQLNGSSFNLGQFVGGPPNLSIKAGGIVNSASFAPNTPVAPGSLVSVYGTFPVNTAQATGVPLPFALSGLSIQIGGIRAPLLYVSATQANVQVPWELAGQTQATVTAAINTETSTSVNLTLATFAPGVFLINAQGQGAIVDAFSGQLIGPSNPARVGSTIAIYCTGLGLVTNQPLTGDAASTTVLSPTIHPPTVIIGGVPTVPTFSGLAPTFVGLYQINAQIPPGVLVGDAVPLVVTFNGTNSNTATIAIH